MLHGDLHDLLLVDDHAVRRPEDLLEVGVRILDRVAGRACARRIRCACPGPAGPAGTAPPAPSGPRTGRARALDQLAHPGALELEHAVGVARRRASRTSRRRPAARGRCPARLPLRRSVAHGVLDHGRFRRPRKSIFSRPSFSTPFMSNWVTIRRESSPRVLRELQRQVVHERRVADHDAGRVDAVLARRPSSAWAVSIDLARLGFAPVGLSSSGDSFSASSIEYSRPRTAAGYILQSRSPIDAGNPSTRAASRIPCFPLIVWNVMICATWSAPYRSATYWMTCRGGVVEVHVDVRHLHALGVQEPLEDQPVPQRVEVGDAQRSTTRPIRRRDPAPARPGCRARGRTGSGPTPSGSTRRSPWGRSRPAPRRCARGCSSVIVPVPVARAPRPPAPAGSASTAPVRRIELRQVELPERQVQLADSAMASVASHASGTEANTARISSGVFR